MAELVLLLFALVALGSPPVSICFVLVAIGVSVWRQSNVRKELGDFRQESQKQNDALHRELVDLRRQLAAASRPEAQVALPPADFNVQGRPQSEPEKTVAEGTMRVSSQ